MNIFEFLGVSEASTKDEAGNVYFAIGDCREYNDLQEVVGSDLVELDINNYFMDRESYEKYAEYTIEIADEAKKFDAVRRPYYRMRGKPVTEEQAFDIIRRTEVGAHWGMFCGLDEHEEYVGSLNFNNWVLPRNHYPKGYGWVHTDGTIGGNAITQRYPTVIEFVQEWLVNLMAFPYLDLVIAVTSWNEVPPEGWGVLNRVAFHRENYDKEFNQAVEVGIYVHDKTIQILGREDTVKKYEEYSELYGKDRDKFEPEYYEKRGIVQADERYLRRCFESFGIDVDSTLAKIPAYEWKDRDE